MKRYLFFLRAYNDIDNIAPVIYYLLRRDTGLRIDVSIYSHDFAYRGNENLTFLKDEFGERIRITWLPARLGLDYDRLFAPGVVRSLYRRASRRNPASAVRKQLTGERSRGESSRARTVESAVESLLAEGPWPALVAFDQNRMRPIRGLLAALRSLGIPRIVSLPVSPRVNVNVYRNTELDAPNLDFMRARDDYSGFDRVAFTDRLYPESLAQVYRLFGAASPVEGKAVVLGSLRYTPEWLRIRSAFTPAYHRETSKLKLVFFLSRPRTNAFWEEVLRTIRFVSAFPDVELVVKPHTRSMTFEAAAGSSVRVADDVPSSALIEWADAVLVWGSSVALEAFVKRKKVLYLDYVHANRNIYGMFGAGAVLRCRDDLHQAIATLLRDPEGLPYDQVGADDLIREIVHAGGGRPVVDRYLEYIDESTFADRPTAEVPQA